MLRTLWIAALIAVTAACSSAGRPGATPAASPDPLSGTYTGVGSMTAIDRMRAITLAFTKLHPAVAFKLVVVDTETSIVQIKSGDADADFGFIGRDLLPTEGPVATTLMGATGSAFAVNAANPVRSLTKAQLRSILTGATTDWSDFGGGSTPIRLVVREPTSQTRAGLEAYVFGKDKPAYPSSAIVTTSSNMASGEMLDALKSFSGAIGMVTLDSAALANKSIAVVQMDGIAPTLGNLLSGIWPVRRPLYLTTNQNPAAVQPAIRALVAFVKSPAGQKLISGQ